MRFEPEPAHLGMNAQARPRPAAALLGLALILAAGACTRPGAGGDVLAVVNGTEITESELANELEHLPAAAAGSDAANRRRAALNALVERKLLVALAREQKLDAAPSTRQDIRRSDETLLADAASGWLAGSPPRIDDAATAAFVSAHPELGRPTLYAVDQIVFPRPQDAGLVQRIGGAPTLDAVQDLLNAGGIAGQRSFGTWTSVSMPAELIRRVETSDGKEPLVFSGGQDVMIAGVRIAQRSISPSDAQLKTVAARTLQQQAQDERVRKWLANARSTARISYSGGAAPAPAN